VPSTTCCRNTAAVHSLQVHCKHYYTTTCLQRLHMNCTFTAQVRKQKTGQPNPQAHATGAKPYLVRGTVVGFHHSAPGNHVHTSANKQFQRNKKMTKEHHVAELGSLC
jgi:hypothetical protein